MERSLKKIALDTNAVLSITKGQNVLEELRRELGNSAQIVIPSQVRQELSALENRDQQSRKRIGLVIAFIALFGVKTKKVDAKNADAALVKLSQAGWIVVTNDRDLLREIKNRSGQTRSLSRNRLKQEDG